MDPIAVLELQGRNARKPFDFDFIRREQEETVFAQLHRKEVTLLLGPRQCGKTCLLRRVVSRVEQDSDGRALYLNLDNLTLRRAFASPVELVLFLENRGYGKGDVLILDEAQRLDDPGLYVKQVHDLDPGLKIVVSGSSSTEIRAKTREHLTGRRRLVQLAPLSLRELAMHTGTGWRPGTTLDSAGSAASRRLFEEMAVHGGYPGVWNEADPQERPVVITDIYDSYVRRDVIDFLGLRNVGAFNDVVRALAGQAGGMVVWSELSRLVGADVRSIRSYVDILEQTYVTRRLLPFTGRARTEIAKSPKCPFADNGMLNASGAGFAPFAHRADRGVLTENLAVSELFKNATDEPRYWRTTSGAEVDMVLPGSGTPVPIEVKAGAFTRPVVPKGLRSFIARYSPLAAFLLHSGEAMETVVGSTPVMFLPAWTALVERPWEKCA